MPPTIRGLVAPTPASDVYAVDAIAGVCLGDRGGPAVRAVVQRALQESPQSRYADAGEMLRAIRDARASFRVQLP